jgi:hypothetical protein
MGLRKSMCGDKHRHVSQGAAEAQLRSMRKREGTLRGGENLHTYPCLWYRGWHVGHRKAS